MKNWIKNQSMNWICLYFYWTIINIATIYFICASSSQVVLLFQTKVYLFTIWWFLDLKYQSSQARSSRLQLFCKVGVLDNFLKITKKLCAAVSFFWVHVFSCKVWEFLKNTFFYRTPPNWNKKTNQFIFWILTKFVGELLWWSLFIINLRTCKR